MKLLVVDPAGVALDFACRCEAAGHAVKHFITQTEKTKHIGRGLTDIVDDLNKWLLWPDVIFNADNIKYHRELDRAREAGVVCLSSTAETAAWELDRTVGMEVLRKAGIPVPAYVEFDNYDKAIAYVKQHMVRFVSKPSGDGEKSLSYVSKSPEDMIYMLERWKRASKLKSSFLIQEFIEGAEMAVGGWFGPAGWCRGWCENFEFKKLCVGNLGVTTGEQGTVLRYVQASRLAKKVLAPLASQLAKANYVGYVDVNCIIDADGHPWPLEFTMRPGWPTFQIQQELLHGYKCDPLQWLYDLATGKDSKAFQLDRVAAGVVLSIPDYPYSHLTRKEVTGVPVYGITKALRPHIHFCEMMMGTAPVTVGETVITSPMPVTAGDYVLVATGAGATVREATGQAYRRLKRLLVPNSPMWRTDIGTRLRKELPAIQEMGFATGMQY